LGQLLDDDSHLCTVTEFERRNNGAFATNERAPGLGPRGLSQIGGSYFRASSFIAFAIRNFNTVFAGILIDSPVWGLRPMRALRFTTTSLPTPGNTNSFFACFAASVASSSRISTLCFLVISNLSAKCPAICDLVIILPMMPSFPYEGSSQM